MISHNDARAMIQQRQTKKRFAHSVQVASIAVSLAEVFDVDLDKADIAGLLHDYAKNLDRDVLIHLGKEAGLAPELLAHPHLLHAPVGAYLLARDGILTDVDMLNAIASHTVGKENMSPLAQIVYVADYLESHLEKWDDSVKDTYTARGLSVLTLWVVQETHRYLEAQSAYVHPDSLALRRELQSKVKEREVQF